MSYRIEPVDLTSRWRPQIGEVVASAFGGEAECVLRDVEQTTTVPGSSASRYFAAIEDDELIGFNAFIAHHLGHADRPVLAFQSCWTATSPHHRGKKVFQNIILGAHEELRKEGASLIIGWPNPISEPLFVHKLGYRRETSVKRNLPGPLAPYFFGQAPLRPSGIRQNDRELIALKRRRHGERLLVEEDEGGLIWGVLRERDTRFGKIKMFDVGGLDFNQAGAGKRLASRLRRRMPLVAFWQIVSERRNSLNSAVGGFVDSTTNPFIWFPLDERAEAFSFDFFAGIRDVY